MWGHICCSAEVSPDQRFHCIKLGTWFMPYYYLLVTMTNREPGLSEEQWKELLGDSLTLREKVYRCVPAATCYQVRYCVMY